MGGMGIGWGTGTVQVWIRVWVWVWGGEGKKKGARAQKGTLSQVGDVPVAGYKKQYIHNTVSCTVSCTVTIQKDLLVGAWPLYSTVRSTLLSLLHLVPPFHPPLLSFPSTL